MEDKTLLALCLALGTLGITILYLCSIYIQIPKEDFIEAPEDSTLIQATILHASTNNGITNLYLNRCHQFNAIAFEEINTSKKEITFKGKQLEDSILIEKIIED